MIYVGADHHGFQLKEEVLNYLKKKGYQIQNLGADSEEPTDYPLIAEKVAIKVKEDYNNRGVLLCGSGAGVCIAANKIPGIRAAQAWDPEIAMAARNDDNINVICIASDRQKTDDVVKIIQKFLDTSYGGAERFKRRLQQIFDLENKY